MIPALKLFGARSRAAYATAALTPESAAKLRTARDTGGLLLADYEDAPVQVDETDAGLVVSGARHAVLLTPDGSAVVRALPESESLDEALEVGSRVRLDYVKAKQSPTGGMAQYFHGKAGRIISIEKDGRSRMYRVRLFHPVEIPRVGEVTDDLWSREFLRPLKPTETESVEEARGGKPLPTENTSYGFYGTMRSAWSADGVYEAMSAAILKATKAPPKEVRLYLDSKYGRHLADALIGRAKKTGDGSTEKDLLAAIDDVLPQAVKALPGFMKMSESEQVAETRPLTEDAGDIEIILNFSNFVRTKGGGMAKAGSWEKIHHYMTFGAPMDAAHKAAKEAFRAALKKDRKLLKMIDDSGFKLHESQDPTPMKTKTRLIEDDYAEIVVDDNGLALLVNGELVATEDCDLSSPESCQRAEDALVRQAAALGFTIEEGTFDASTTGGGTVRNGDAHDNFDDGESYYARRYRRRTSDASTGNPVMPQIESWRGWTDDEKREYLAAFGVVGEAADFILPILNQSANDATFYNSLAEAFPFKKKGKADDDEEDEEEDDEDMEDEEDEEEYEENLLADVTAFLAEHSKLLTRPEQVREFDEAVRAGRYEEALEAAEVLAGTVGQLDEYRRRMGSSLARFRRSLKTQTASEKQQNRKRRMKYRASPGMRRKAQRYRIRTRRFRRAHESLGESKFAKVPHWKDGTKLRIGKTVWTVDGTSDVDEVSRDEGGVRAAYYISAGPKEEVLTIVDAKGGGYLADMGNGKNISVQVVKEDVEQLAEVKATRRIARAMKKAGNQFAVWSDDSDVTYHRTLEDAKREAKKNPEGADDGDGGTMTRTWTDIDELIDVLEGQASEQVGFDLDEAITFKKGDTVLFSTGDPKEAKALGRKVGEKGQVTGMKKSGGSTYVTVKWARGGSSSIAADLLRRATADYEDNLESVSTLAHIASQALQESDAPLTFAGLREAVQEATGEAVSDPALMRVVSQFCESGLVSYSPMKGYALIEVEDAEARAKLAKAARTAGHKFVVTLSNGTPTFQATQEDANALWKSLHPKMRGMKTTISGYIQSLGMGDEDETA